MSTANSRARGRAIAPQQTNGGGNTGSEQQGGVSTELATSAIGAIFGIGGFVGSLLFARKLSRIETETIPWSSILVPGIAGIGGIVLGTIIAPVGTR